MTHKDQLIKRLLNSIELDIDSQIKDMLDVFSEYDWNPIDVHNIEKFNYIKDKIEKDEYNKPEIYEFLTMVDTESSSHVAAVIVQLNLLML